MDLSRLQDICPTTGSSNNELEHNVSVVRAQKGRVERYRILARKKMKKESYLV